MTWKEFLLKSYAYKRMSIEKWHHTRFIAYRSTIAPHLNPKFIPKTIDLFMPLDGQQAQQSISEEAEQGFIEHYKKYLTETQKS